MPTLTVKQVIAAELLRVCKEVTRTLREKDNKKEKKRKFSREEVAEIERQMAACGWTGGAASNMMKLWSLLHDAPELKAGSMLPLELFAVVLIEAGSHHAYPVKVPLIATSKDGYLWNPPDGVVTNWKFLASDKPVYATDEQVEQCIKDMTPIQWQKIYIFDVFKPIVDAAMSREVVVEDVPGSDRSGDEEITLANGRIITMSGVAPDKDGN